jgi:putative membrane protein
MSRKPMLALGVAATLALGLTAAQAQSGTPQMNSNSMAKPSSSMNGSSGMNQKASKADQKFLMEGMQGDMAEVQLGKLAQQKGHSEDVKQFGQMLEQDHSQHLQQAQQEAQQLGITPPQQVNAKQKATYERMNKLSGAQFDKQFTKHAVADHKKDVAEYQKEAKSKSPLAQFAQQTVPTLQKHLQTAQSIESKGAMTGAKSGAK